MRDNLGLLSCLSAVYKMYWKFKSKEQKCKDTVVLHSDIERHELFLFILAASWSSMTRDHSCTSFNSPTTSLHVIRSKWNPNWQQMRKEVDKKIKAESNISILNPECVCVYFFDMFPSESRSWLPSKLQWASDKGEMKWQVGECTAREAKSEREGSFTASSIPVQAYQLGERRERWSKRQVALPRRHRERQRQSEKERKREGERKRERLMAYGS